MINRLQCRRLYVRAQSGRGLQAVLWRERGAVAHRTTSREEKENVAQLCQVSEEEHLELPPLA